MQGRTINWDTVIMLQPGNCAARTLQGFMRTGRLNMEIPDPCAVLLVVNGSGLKESTLDSLNKFNPTSKKEWALSVLSCVNSLLLCVGC